jgi:hypothetical protein
VQTPKDYVAAMAVLQDQRLSRDDIETLISALIPRARELIAKDLERLGGELLVPDEDKLDLKRRLGWD